jgi:hypothetical protein
MRVMRVMRVMLWMMKDEGLNVGPVWTLRLSKVYLGENT